MKITTCNLKCDEEYNIYLVKEKSMYYSSISKIVKPEEVCEIMCNVFNLHERSEEYGFMMALNTAGRLLGIFEISHGAIDSTYMNPREILLRALLIGSKSIILIHNHPSREANPSRDDKRTTQRIKDASHLIGIELLDHIIIGGRNNFYSFKGNKIIE